MSRTLLAAAAALPLLVSSAGAEDLAVQLEPKEFVFQPSGTMSPIRPSPKRLTAGDEKTIAAAKEALGEAMAEITVVFTHAIGGKARGIYVGKSKPDAEHPDLLALDLNGDGKIDPKAEIRGVTTQTGNFRGRRGTYAMIREAKVAWQIGRTTRSLGVMVVSQNGGPWTATLMPTHYLGGTAKVGEKSFEVAVADMDADGDFGGKKDLWLVREAGSTARPASAYGMSGWKEGKFVAGHRVMAHGLENGMIKLTADPAEGPDPADLAKARTRVEHMWFERFAPTKEQFAKQRGLDLTRPQAKEPIQWHYVTFEKAQAMAKKESKHLFVDVMAFWCVWCYRMDYTTYPDAEVATLMNEKFICVKIIQEQDPAGDYQRVRGLLGARGIPAMGIWSPAGDHTKTIGGWKKPEDFLTDLKAGLAPAGDDK